MFVVTYTYSRMIVPASDILFASSSCFLVLIYKTEEGTAPPIILILMSITWYLFTEDKTMNCVWHIFIFRFPSKKARLPNC